MLLIPMTPVPIPRSGLLYSYPSPPFPPFHRPLFSASQVIVFSQWTGMLDLLEVPLKRNGYKYRRYVTGSTYACADEYRYCA